MMMFQTLHRCMACEGATLKLRCRTCGHLRIWSKEDAFRLYGPDAAPFDIRRSSYCGECRERDNFAVFI
ncbi:MAG TPA: hypothetical protein VGH03_01405 [Caulobacteraceae bacterium]|jgi:hypothetical protein